MQGDAGCEVLGAGCRVQGAESKNSIVWTL